MTKEMMRLMRRCESDGKLRRMWIFVKDQNLPEWANAAGPWLDLFGKVAPAVIAGAVLFVGQRLSDASDKVYARLEAIEKTLAMTCETLERNTAADEVADAQLLSLRTDMTRVMTRLGLD